jgi:hypothetical protein
MKAPEAGIEFDSAMSGGPKVITMTPKKTGSFRFFCSKKLLFLESHWEKGMEGGARGGRVAKAGRAVGILAGLGLRN